MKNFKIVTRFLPTQGRGSDFEYTDFDNYNDAFSYCFKKARNEECDKVELYERTDPTMKSARLCPIAEFYHW